MRWLRRAAFALILVAATSAGAAPSAAAKNKASDLRAARELYDKGITAYNLGEYELAAEQLKRSYELSKAPQLLFNIAQAYRAKGEHKEALIFYRNYLRLMPGARNRADAEALALEMERKSAEDDKAAKERADREATAKVEANRRAAAEAEAHAAELRAQQRAVAAGVAAGTAPSTDNRLIAVAPSPHTPVYKKWWFWTAIGGAVAAVTVVAVVVPLSQRTVTPSGSLGTIDGR